MRLSVVIPTLDEAAELPVTLARTVPLDGVAEVIVSDGGSTDGTPDLARAGGARVVTGPPGRGGQLRRGAQAAVGEVVVFLHADTWLPADAAGVIRRLLARPGTVGGGFRKAFRDGTAVIRLAAAWRSMVFTRVTGRFFGDQAVFVRRDVLEAADGVPDVPLMEEFELARRLVRHGRLRLAPATVLTSARRFGSHGLLRTWWLMGRIEYGYWRGEPLDALSRKYLGR